MMLVKVDVDGADQVYRHGDVLDVALWYPRLENSKIKAILVDLVDVHAADPFKTHYDFARDGWVIERPKLVGEFKDKTEWFEVAFLPGRYDDGLEK